MRLGLRKALPAIACASIGALLLAASAIFARELPWGCEAPRRAVILSVQYRSVSRDDPRQTIRNGGEIVRVYRHYTDASYLLDGVEGTIELQGHRNDLAPGSRATLTVPVPCSEGRYAFFGDRYAGFWIASLCGLLLLVAAIGHALPLIQSAAPKGSPRTGGGKTGKAGK